MDDYERMRASYEIMRENERLRLVRSSPELAEATAEVARLGRALADVAMCDSSDCGRCIACLVRRAEKAERFVATADSEWKARAEKAERELQASESCVAFERVTIAELRLEAHQLGTNLHLARLERDEALQLRTRAERVGEAVLRLGDLRMIANFCSATDMSRALHDIADALEVEDADG